jgi:hypothetical protein
VRNGNHAMRYTIYEDPLTHLFAFVALPRSFVEGDELPTVAIDRWFDSPEEATMTLRTLLDLEDVGQDPSWEDVTPEVTATQWSVPCSCH